MNIISMLYLRWMACLDDSWKIADWEENPGYDLVKIACWIFYWFSAQVDWENYRIHFTLSITDYEQFAFLICMTKRNQV